MIKTNKHNYFYYTFGVLFIWSLLIAISILLNYRIGTQQIDFDRIIIIHITLWLVGAFLSIPILYILLKSSEKETSNEIEMFHLFINTIELPILVFNKEKRKISFINSYAERAFEIIKQTKNTYSIPELKCLTEELEKNSKTIIEYIKIEQKCESKEGNENIYEVILKDIKISGHYYTLAVLNDKSEDEKSFREINDYIDDLHAKEDALEDNAFQLIQLNIKLEESEEKLREANANKDKFFSIVAHDLKSPFVGLLGISEMLDNDYDDFDEKERKELIKSLYDISKNTFELLEGLLDWARAKQGQMDFNPKMFNLFNVADSLINLLKANAFRKEITLVNNVEFSTEVFGDRDMISTVLRNLIANAIKFTPRNGEIKIISEEENGFAKITVQDSGIGISEKNMEKLFRIEVNHTTLGTNSEKGTGLGLILCKELIEKHGTNIWVESELGKGSKFIFTLPVTKEIAEIQTNS